MASITEGSVPQPQTAVAFPLRLSAALATLAAGIGALVLAVLLFRDAPAQTLVGGGVDYFILGVFALAAVLLLVGGGLILTRPGLGGALGLSGALVLVAAFLFAKSFGYAPAALVVLAFAGSLAALVGNDRLQRRVDPRIIYRQSIFTRVTHWTWAIALFFLLLTGLQIWNAHPALNIGQESGFEYDNAILRIGAENTDAGPRGYTILFGQKFDTTGFLGMSGSQTRPQFVGFPGWATIPSTRDLATGRVIHFFFAWVFVGALAVWLVASLLNRHLWRDIILKPRDFRELPRDIVDHIKFRFHHRRTYSPLQKVAYFTVFIILFPLIILTGLTMSPAMDAAWPWLLDIFGGRQTARTIHFLAMMGLVLFFVVHVIMVVLAGPFNELRSMITGHYRISADPHAGEEQAQ